MNMTETEYNNHNGKQSNMNDRIKVIHIKDSLKDKDGLYFYIGRTSKNKKKNEKFIYLEGLGNPFPIDKEIADKNQARNDVIQQFRKYAREQYIKKGILKKSVETIAGHLLQLEDKQTIYLVCLCKPLACHGDVIREAVIKIARSRTRDTTEY